MEVILLTVLVLGSKVTLNASHFNASRSFTYAIRTLRVGHYDPQTLVSKCLQLGTQRNSVGPDLVSLPKTIALAPIAPGLRRF